MSGRAARRSGCTPGRLRRPGWPKAGLGEEALTLGVQGAKIRAGHDHPMQQDLKLLVGLLTDGLDLALVAEARRLINEEGTQRRHVPLAQDLAQSLDVTIIAGCHRRRSTSQVGVGRADVAPGAYGPDPAGAAISSGLRVSRRPPPMVPTRL